MGKPVGLTVKEILALPPREAPYETKDDAVTGGYIVKWPTGAVSYVQRHEFEPEKRAALDRWAAHIEQIVEGGSEATIVELRPSA
jgi:hypothetical protein